MEQNVLNTQ